MGREVRDILAKPNISNATLREGWEPRWLRVQFLAAEGWDPVASTRVR